MCGLLVSQGEWPSVGQHLAELGLPDSSNPGSWWAATDKVRVLVDLESTLGAASGQSFFHRVL